VGTLCEEIRYCYELSRTRDDAEFKVPSSPSGSGDEKAGGAEARRFHAWPVQDGEFSDMIEPTGKASSGGSGSSYCIAESPLVQAIRKESEDALFESNDIIPKPVQKRSER
jgi:hypothetical protein